jgi:DNA-binding HxlR family transcriptional regulator
MVETTGTSIDEALARINSTRPVLAQIADKWSIRILSVVCTRPSRFNVILRRLDGITHKALADALRRLERNGLIARRVIPTTPIGVEYSITPLGSTLREPFDALCSWVVAYSDNVLEAQVIFDNAADVRITR